MKVIDYSRPKITALEFEAREAARLTKEISDIQTDAGWKFLFLCDKSSDVKRETLLGNLEADLANRLELSKRRALQEVLEGLYPTDDLGFVQCNLREERRVVWQALSDGLPEAEIQALREQYRWQRDTSFLGFSQLPVEI